MRDVEPPCLPAPSEPAPYQPEPRTGRRAALAAIPFALAPFTLAPAARAAPAPLLPRAMVVAALLAQENAACEALFAAEDTPAEPAALKACNAAYAAWEAGMRDLAQEPAATPQDMFTKLALVLVALRDGPADAERDMLNSVLLDIWRSMPELRPLMRWSPDSERGRMPGRVGA